jgi:hypothetical protein
VRVRGNESFALGVISDGDAGRPAALLDEERVGLANAAAVRAALLPRRELLGSPPHGPGAHGAPRPGFAPTRPGLVRCWASWLLVLMVASARRRRWVELVCDRATGAVEFAVESVHGPGFPAETLTVAFGRPRALPGRPVDALPDAPEQNPSCKALCGLTRRGPGVQRRPVRSGWRSSPLSTHR